MALKPKQYSDICDNINFVHIPKTAGTSFREALGNSFHLFKDYGLDSQQTSSLVKQYSYKENDLFYLKQIMLEKGKFCIAGHTPLMKYVDYTSVTNIVSFVREPLAQVLSHYNHYVKYHDFDEGINAFINKLFSKNLQTKRLGIMPLGLIGYIGLTETYDESIDIINEQYGLSLGRKKYNVNKSKVISDDALEQSLREQFVENNQQDIAMYEEAKFLHAQRVILRKESKPWTYGCTAINQYKRLHGCAYRYQNDTPVTLLVKVNDKVINTVIAKDFYGAFVRANFPRGRYIGFNIALPKGISSDDIIDVYVKETGQKLNFKALKVSLK